jgi:serine/threonine-protein kinase
MVVNYTTRGDAFVAEKPRVWSETRIQGTDILRGFDVAPDGKRVAVLMPLENAESQDTRHRVTLVLNFFEEVRRRVAASGQ